MPYFEYTPELTEQFYSRLARPIKQKNLETLANFRIEALRRGLSGTPYESIGASQIETAGNQYLNDLWSNLNWQLAGFKRQERLAEEARRWQERMADIERQWRTEEAEKQRAFQMRLAEMSKPEKPKFWDYLGEGIGASLPFIGAKFLL